MPSDVLCGGLSALSGLLISTGYNIPRHAIFSAAAASHANTADTAFFRGARGRLASVPLTLTSLATFVLASKYGPVSVAMPIQMSCALLSSMIIQMALGMVSYNKSRRIGTIALVAGSVSLLNVGPTDPQSMEAIDLPSLVNTPNAIIWLAFMLLPLVLVLPCMKMMPEGRCRSLLCAFLFADGSAICATVGKMLTLTSGALQVFLALCFGLLALSALLGMEFAVHSCDEPSEYLPFNQSIQLVINALAGLFLWGDGARIQEPLAYFIVVLEMLLCVYLCSELDILSPLESPAPRQVIHMESGSRDGLARELDTVGETPCPS